MHWLFAVQGHPATSGAGGVTVTSTLLPLALLAITPMVFPPLGLKLSVIVDPTHAETYEVLKYQL
jgi:hypothetical protein